MAAEQVPAGAGTELTREITCTSFLDVFQRSYNAVSFSYYSHCPIYDSIERHYTTGEDCGSHSQEVQEDQALDICFIYAGGCHVADSITAAPGGTVKFWKGPLPANF